MPRKVWAVTTMAPPVVRPGKVNHDLAGRPGDNLQGFRRTIRFDQAGVHGLRAEAGAVDRDLSARLDQRDGADQRPVIDQEVRQPVAACQHQQHQQDNEHDPAAILSAGRLCRGSLSVNIFHGEC